MTLERRTVVMKIFLSLTLLGSLIGCRQDQPPSPTPSIPALESGQACDAETLNNRIKTLEAEKVALLGIKNDLEARLKTAGAQPPSAQDKVNHIVNALCPPSHTVGGVICSVLAQATLSSCGIVDQGGGSYTFNPPTQACPCWIREYLTGEDHQDC